VLEVTVIRFVLQFNLDYRLTLLNVIWALGWAMIVLAVLVHLPTRVIGAIGLALIVTHNLFDGVRANTFGAVAPVWSLLHVPGIILPGPAHVVFSAYPLIPWIGVTAAGYALGSLWDLSSERGRALLLRIGVGCIVAFLVLRGFNVYGDPAPWSV